MNYIYSIFSLTILFLIVTFARRFFHKRTTPVNNKYQYFDVSHYRKKRYFFTKNENIFFQRLNKILNSLDSKYVIFSKVRVSDIISTDLKSTWSWKIINPRHFDFVICDINNDFEPIIIIELDDSSHNDESVGKRDNIKNEICKHINLPLIRTCGKESDEQIKQSLLEIL